MNIRVIIAIATKEIRDSLRNRWFMLCTVGFAVLALALSYISLVGAGVTGFTGFGPTTAGLVNLVMLVVPLIGLTIGASSIASERENGTLRLLLSQPIGAVEVLLGKYLGLAAALIASLAIGFALSGAVMAYKAGGASASTYAALIGHTFLLALAMLSVGMLLSVLVRKPAVATGLAVTLWLTVVLLGDLGLMGSAVMFRLGAPELFHLAVANPLQAFKISTVLSINASLDTLGPAGIFAMRQYGQSLSLVLYGVLVAWTIVPLGAGALFFRMRPKP